MALEIKEIKNMTFNQNKAVMELKMLLKTQIKKQVKNVGSKRETVGWVSLSTFLIKTKLTLIAWINEYFNYLDIMISTQKNFM